MKLQKLLKKLALPVFALVVVSMLAACSSPSGGDSGNGNGGKTDNPPALEDTTEYGIDLGSLTTEQQEALKDAIEAAGGSVGETMTGADIEDLKDALSEAGYTYTEKDGTVTIEKKPASSQSSSGDTSPVSGDPLFDISELTVSATEFDWTEGEWLLKEIQEISADDKYYSERKIKADSSGIKFTAIKETSSGTIPANATEEQKAFLLASGGTITGNKFTITAVADAEKLANKNKDIDARFMSYEQHCTIKTNSDKTKYYWTEDEDVTYEDKSGNVIETATSTIKYYLKKVSAGTNTGNKTDTGIGNKTDTGIDNKTDTGTGEKSDTFNVKYKDIYLLKDLSADDFSLDAFLVMFDDSEYTLSGNTVTLKGESALNIFMSETGKKKELTYVTFLVYKNNVLIPLTQEQYQYVCNNLIYKEDYDMDADVGSKIMILTESGYAKGMTPSGEQTTTHDSTSEGTSSTSYSGKIIPDKAYQVYDNKEYQGKEVKGSTFIATVLEHGWVEGKDYVVDNDKFTITLKGYTPSTDEDSETPSGNLTPLSSDPLFATTEVTVAASQIEWTEGEWLLQFIQEELTGDHAGTIIIEERNIKADSSGISITGVKETTYGTIPAEATEEQIAEAKKMGYIFNEDRYTYTKEADAKELEEANSKIKDDSWYKENLKTNADKTKFYWTYSGEHSSSVGTWVVRQCLKKLSGTSTPVILTSTGGENNGTTQDDTSSGDSSASPKS